MGFIKEFFKKPKPILTEEDNKELREIQRQAYLKEAKILVEEQAKLRARNELGIKQKREEF